MVLDRLCSRDDEASHHVAAARLMIQLEHAALAGGTMEAATDSEAARVLGFTEGKLVEGKDYQGNGRPDDPFRLAGHLLYYQWSKALLRQLGVCEPESCMRHLGHGEDGLWLERWETEQGDFWFVVEVPFLDAPVRE